MKNGWKTKTLGDLCSFENGDRGENYPSKSVQTTSGVPFINAGHLCESGIDFSDMNYIPRERFELLGNGKIQKDDILFCLRGSLGKFATVGDLSEGAIASSLVIIRPSDAILNEFVLAYLQSDLCAEMVRDFRNGAAQPNLAAASLKKFTIPVPPLPEQRRIVGILDEAFEGISTTKANAEKNFQNARAIFESHLQSVFTRGGEGWVEHRLGDLSRITYGYTESASPEKIGPHFLRITDIQNNRVDWPTVPYCPIDACDLPKYKLADGDIVFARTGATTGKSYLVTNPPEAIFASYLIRVQLSNKELLPNFVNLFFQTHSYWDTIRAGVSGSAQGGFNATKLGELVIPFPRSSKEQHNVVTQLDSLAAKTQRLTSIYERKLAALDALKKSLLHQAFTGEL
jgi:type I restriction enzyme, S subunit